MTVADTTIRIVFRGVRGSYPMPGPTTLRYGGNTSCQEIRAGGRLLIFDAGTGIIGLGQDLAQEGVPKHIALFFSHNHHDHTSGLLYFKPAYNPNVTMHIYGPTEERGSILNTLEDLSSPVAHPVQLSKMGMKFTCDTIDSGTVVVWSPGDVTPRIIAPEEKTSPGDVVVRVLKNSVHPLAGVLNLRLEYAGKSYVYATDVEGDPEKGDSLLAGFARGADLLAHDGQYTDEEYESLRKGWGHSTIRMAVKTAEMAGVDRLAIIHHDPGYSDDQLDRMAEEAKALLPGAFLAREGQEITL